MYTVYKHTSPSNKIYIGVTSQVPEARWKNGNGYVENEYFTRAIKKYGWDNIKHEILATGLTKNEAEKMEIELINLHKSNNRKFGYNIENGGSLIGKHSDYTKKKISESLKGERNPRYGKKFPNSRKEPMPEKERLNRSLSHKNQIPVNKKKTYQYTKDGFLVNTYESMTRASESTGIDVSNICRCINGRIKTSGGYVWKTINTGTDQKI